MSAPRPLSVVQEQIAEAVAARKCHSCGCLHKTVEALSGTDAGRAELAPVLAQARGVFVAKQYDCLGCPTCYPALAANAFAEQFPEVGAGLDLCPVEEPEQRKGWPPLPGDYKVIRYGAPVAVCTLNSDSLMAALEREAVVDTLLDIVTIGAGTSVVVRPPGPPRFSLPISFSRLRLSVASTWMRRRRPPDDTLRGTPCRSVASRQGP